MTTGIGYIVSLAFDPYEIFYYRKRSTTKSSITRRLVGAVLVLFRILPVMFLVIAAGLLFKNGATNQAALIDETSLISWLNMFGVVSGLLVGAYVAIFSGVSVYASETFYKKIFGKWLAGRVASETIATLANISALFSSKQLIPWAAITNIFSPVLAILCNLLAIITCITMLIFERRSLPTEGSKTNLLFIIIVFISGIVGLVLGISSPAVPEPGKLSLIFIAIALILIQIGAIIVEAVALAKIVWLSSELSTGWKVFDSIVSFSKLISYLLLLIGLVIMAAKDIENEELFISTALYPNALGLGILVLVTFVNMVGGAVKIYRKSGN
jgi:hypothetical protein